jgi:ABC-2 type transport system permease protein
MLGPGLVVILYKTIGKPCWRNELVIFPCFLCQLFYPLWKIKESSALLHNLAQYNPFSQAVELIRFALYGQFNQEAFIYTFAAFIAFMAAAIIGYNPSKGMMMKKGGA